jgi:probable HAF family extracellular repeat protein
MQTRTAKGTHGRSGCTCRWPATAGVCIALAASVTTALAAPDPVPANTTYRVVQLSSPWAGAALINAKGQVAFTDGEPIEGIPAEGWRRPKFYDGNVVRDLGTLGGPSATIAALNDAGQVAGTSRISATSTVQHAFRWSKETGMVKLAPPGVLSSSASDINRRGWVAGTAQFPGEPAEEWRRAFRWTPQTGMVGLGVLARGSNGAALNDAGTVVGSSASLAVRWPGTSPVPLESSGLSGSARDINNAGQVVGGAERSPGFGVAVLWTPQNGLVDLGLQMRSQAEKINANGLVIGHGYPGPSGPKGFAWCPENGLVMFAKNPVTSSATAHDLNNLGQVVGTREAQPFVWTRAEGIVDLNTRISGAPPELRLREGRAISDNGMIVAVGNTGLVLLVPGSGYNLPPVVVPALIAGPVRRNALLSFSASFRDVDVQDRHKAVWSWGDGSQSVGTVSASPTGTGGTGGGVFGQHAYTREGRYLVRLTVTDSSGKSTTVTQLVVVDDA